MAYKNIEDARAYQKEYYKKPGRKQAIINKNYERRIKLKLKLKEIKINSGCAKCGFKKCSEALEFHHKNPKEKLFNISTGCLTRYSWGKIIEEISKCDILCANCHRQIRCSCCN
jgi:hypothetical protein